MGLPKMEFIDGQKLAEFLDENRGKKLDKKALRTDSNLLAKAGLTVPSHLKLRKQIRVLEYFLLRSQLYTPEGSVISPYRIRGNWSDYAKSWFETIGARKIHLPFIGKIAFLCYPNKRKVICHPESASDIEQIIVDTGGLTFERDPDNVEHRYVKKSCIHLLELYKQREVNQEEINKIGNNAFGRALLAIGLAKKEGENYSFRGNGLLLDEIKKMRADDDMEKTARLILRREQGSQAKIASTIVCLESLERVKLPSKNPIGTGPKFWKSKRTGGRYKRLGHYELVTDICSFDTRTTADVLGKSDPYDGFVTFGSFLDTYYRTYSKEHEEWADTYSFLSWYTDSFAHLFLSKEDLEGIGFPEFKNEKTRRHGRFLERIPGNLSSRPLALSTLKEHVQRTRDSEIIDMNIDLRNSNLESYSPDSYCYSNCYTSSELPVDRELFESTVLRILEEPSNLKDSQGAFYYPDFRFLVASTIGLSLRSVDQILAYVISTNPELSRRLWLFPAFGNVPRRDRPDEQLSNVVLRPFDSIILNY